MPRASSAAYDCCFRRQGLPRAAGRDMSSREWIMVVGATILEAGFVAFIIWSFV
jgi:hypothetical protein